MSTSKAKASKGTLIQVGDGAGSEAFTSIGDVLSFSAPSESMDTIDVTAMDDTAKEFIPSGIVDGGEVTFDVNFAGNDAQHQSLRADLRAGTARNFKILLNDSTGTKTQFAFTGYVTKFDGAKAGIGEQYKASVTIKVTGLPTMTYAS